MEPKMARCTMMGCFLVESLSVYFMSKRCGRLKSSCTVEHCHLRPMASRTCRQTAVLTDPNPYALGRCQTALVSTACCAFTVLPLPLNTLLHDRSSVVVRAGRSYTMLESIASNAT